MRLGSFPSDLPEADPGSAMGAIRNESHASSKAPGILRRRVGCRGGRRNCQGERGLARQPVQ
eukprot:10921807-Alexandrium_andersonii.AAC.1